MRSNRREDEKAEITEVITEGQLKRGDPRCEVEREEGPGEEAAVLRERRSESACRSVKEGARQSVGDAQLKKYELSRTLVRSKSPLPGAGGRTAASETSFESVRVDVLPRHRSSNPVSSSSVDFQGELRRAGEDESSDARLTSCDWAKSDRPAGPSSSSSSEMTSRAAASGSGLASAGASASRSRRRPGGILLTGTTWPA